MGQDGEVATGFASFDAVIRLATHSRAALLAGFSDRLADADVALFAEETLPYLELARGGFALAARASDLAGLDQRAFLRRWGVTGHRPTDTRSEAEERGLERLGRRPTLVEDAREALAAFAHARVALALIPRLPPWAVSWPPRPTYVDVPRPRGAGELVDRLEEVERTVWHLSVLRERSTRDPEPARRTVAFFDAIVFLGSDPAARG
jgi:hypothetical protein